MSVSDAITIGFDGYQDLLTSVSPDTVVCVRGRHAVGKSEGVYQAAARRRSDFYKDPENCRRMIAALSDPTHRAVRHESGWVREWNYEMGMPVVERRLSQMTEGDMIGIPHKELVAGQDATKFMACDWIIQSCHFPVMLFLDERNRAIQGVKQSVFQLADSKAFYGNRLHPETTVVVAENIGDAYQVEQNDPAEISRWVTVSLEPSKEEFFKYAERRLHEAVLDFLRSNPSALEYTGVFEANKKYPDRRAWVKFNNECVSLGILDEDEPPMLLRILAGGYLGVEVGTQFFRFCQERERQVKAIDILTNWSKVKERLTREGPISAEKYVEMVHKIGDWLKGDKNGEVQNTRVLTDEQATQLARFMEACPSEPRMACWALLQRDTSNLFKMHPKIEKLMVATATGEEFTTAEEVESPPVSPGVSTPTGRGRRKI
jgi:hypothetical protein